MCFPSCSCRVKWLLKVAWVDGEELILVVSKLPVKICGRLGLSRIFVGGWDHVGDSLC